MLIKFNKVKKQFIKNVLFTDFDATIVDGERIGIYGENGSGKTNLVELFKFLQQLTISRIIVKIIRLN